MSEQNNVVQHWIWWPSLDTLQINSLISFLLLKVTEYQQDCCVLESMQIQFGQIRRY